MVEITNTDGWIEVKGSDVLVKVRTIQTTKNVKENKSSTEW